MNRRWLVLWGMIASLSVVSLLLDASTLYAQEQAFYAEDFEDVSLTGLPSGWHRTDDRDCGDGDTDNWGVIDCRDHTGSKSAWCAGHPHDHPNDCEHYYTCQGSRMVTEAIPIANYCNLRFQYYHYLNVYSGRNHLKVYRSATYPEADFSNCELVSNWNSDHGWTLDQQGVPAGWTTLYVTWYFYSSSEEGDWQALGAFIDDFQVIGTPIPTRGTATAAGNCNGVIVSWGDVANETLYKVFRNDVGQIGGDLPAGTTSYTDNSAVPGTPYTYSVQACNGACCGLASSQVPGQRAVTPAQVPSVYANGNCNAVVVTWPDVANETLYRIFRNGSPLGSDLPAGTTSYSDNTAVPGMSYQYTVQACNGVCCGSVSSQAPGTRLTWPPQVSILPPAPPNCDSVQICWHDAPNETGYRLYRDDFPVGTTGANDTCLSDVPPIGINHYWVIPFNPCGDGQPSPVVPATFFGPPNQVSGVVASDTLCSGINVSWENVATELGYRVYRNLTVVATVGSDTTHWTDTPAVGTYSYAVQAFNACGDAVMSAADFGTRLSAATPPSNCQASDTSCGFVYVAWQDNSDNENFFKIYRNDSLAGTVQANRTWFYDYPDTGTHVYRVCAWTSACGCSEMSPPDTGRRRNCTADPDSLVVRYDSGTQLLWLYWQPTRDAQGYPLANAAYYVYRGNTPNFIPSAANLRFTTYATQGPDVLDEAFGRAFYVVIARTP
ncbi:MAG TPA: hypothetical protein VGL38_12340 [bacterium]